MIPQLFEKIVDQGRGYEGGIVQAVRNYLLDQTDPVRFAQLQAKYNI